MCKLEINSEIRFWLQFCQRTDSLVLLIQRGHYFNVYRVYKEEKERKKR